MRRRPSRAVCYVEAIIHDSSVCGEASLGVVDLLVENPRNFGDARLELAKAAEEARCFLMIIDVADRRLAAGLAAIANG